MFRIQPESNRISKLNEKSFSELGFTERHHLQEWLANQPDALGEELLIIQKEFNGFDDTKERLDLLAIDKGGNLVIIENKLDDSGRDIVWQALKYASYCSTLSKSQIAEIYQQYLDKYSDEKKNAKIIIAEFLEQEDFAEVVLNSGNDQRLIMVAAKFRKEVTSTVLWLLKHRVFVKCFRVTPFRDGGHLFLTVEQVIPLPEAEELMIGISEKEDEEQTVERGQATRYQLRTDFWHETLKALRSSGVDLYANVSPSKDHWLNTGSGVSGIYYSMIFIRDQVRINFALGTGSKEINKALYDYLYERRDQIDITFGNDLDWRRMDDKKISLIEYSAPFDGHNRENWPAMIAWFVKHVRKMEMAFNNEVPVLKNLVKTLSLKISSDDDSVLDIDPS